MKMAKLLMGLILIVAGVISWAASTIYTSSQNHIIWAYLGTMVIFFLLLDNLPKFELAGFAQQPKPAPLPQPEVHEASGLEQSKYLQDIHDVEDFVTRQLQDKLGMGAIYKMLKLAGYNDEIITVVLEKLKAKGVLQVQQPEPQPVKHEVAEEPEQEPSEDITIKAPPRYRGRPKKEVKQ
jgi:hypothetical protein